MVRVVIQRPQGSFSRLGAVRTAWWPLVRLREVGRVAASRHVVLVEASVFPAGHQEHVADRNKEKKQLKLSNFLFLKKSCFIFDIICAVFCVQKIQSVLVL